MKEERGITLASLVVTVVVLFILLGVSVKLGSDSLDDTRLQTFYTELGLVQIRVDHIASTNENYVKNGKTIYLKNQGLSYQEISQDQRNFLENIIEEYELKVSAKTFRYFTPEEIEEFFDLKDIQHYLFIDFDSRTIISEDGVKVKGQTYYLLENEIYIFEKDEEKNKGEIEYLIYDVTEYTTDKYKIIITPKNSIGDLGKNGYIKYKNITSKYWETSTNTEMIVELGKQYNIIYVDANDNSIEKTIMVELDTQNKNTPTVVEITK